MEKALIIPKADSKTHPSIGPAASGQSLELGALANCWLISRIVVFKGTKAPSPQPEKLWNPSAWFLRAPKLPLREQKVNSCSKDPHGK